MSEEKRIVVEKHYYHHRVVHEVPRPEPPRPIIQVQREKRGVVDGLFGAAVVVAGLLLGGSLGSRSK